MKKFEYLFKEVTLDFESNYKASETTLLSELVKVLNNKYGKDGWEIIKYDLNYNYHYPAGSNKPKPYTLASYNVMFKREILENIL